MEALEGKVDRTALRFDVQAQTNINIANNIDLMEESGSVKSPTPFVNHKPQALNNVLPVVSEALQSPTDFFNSLGQAGYILVDHQEPICYGAPYYPTLQAQSNPLVFQSFKTIICCT